MSILRVPLWQYELDGERADYGAMTPDAASRYAVFFGISRGIKVESINLRFTGELLLNLDTNLNPFMLKKLQEGEAVIDLRTLEYLVIG